MLNNDKLKLMNEIARFSKKEAKSERPALRYFKGDYLAKHAMQSFFAYSVSFLLILGVAFLYRLEWLLNIIDVMEVVNIAAKCAVLYIAGLAVFEMLSSVIYRRRYAAAMKKREEHLMKLNRLKKRYDLQEQMRDLIREGGRNA